MTVTAWILAATSVATLLVMVVGMWAALQRRLGRLEGQVEALTRMIEQVTAWQSTELQRRLSEQRWR